MRRPPKYVQGFIDRHGNPRWYFRRPGFKRAPLPGLPWSPEFMAAMPTQGVRAAKIKTDGYRTWTEADIEAFEAVHPIGTRARLALGLLLYTAQRRSDVVMLGRQHVHAGVLHVRQRKAVT